MDYEFTRDIGGHAHARFSMEHLAIGRWFSEELLTEAKIEALLAELKAVQNGEKAEFHQHSFELSLSINRDNVLLTPRHNDIETSFEHEHASTPELEDEFWAHSNSLENDIAIDSRNTELYQQESRSECGFIDFKEALVAWQHYLSRY